MQKISNKTEVAVVGLGYVGLPLALELGKNFPTIAFDKSIDKIKSYKNKVDPNKELNLSDFNDSNFVSFTVDPTQLSHADFIIVCVPTPVDLSKAPDNRLLISACQLIGQNMKNGVTVIFESTVYPGLTEEVCIPCLETSSNLIWKKDFFVAYSPERINPGDKSRTMRDIVKVVSGDTERTTNIVAQLYEKIITAGVYKAKSIKVAEAAKVIENTQRDINIALMNELAIIFEKLEIDTEDVLAAANTKWNFLDFKPGLVGGHCIGVDPYYLTHKAEVLGYSPQVILAGRRINDGVPSFIAEKTLKLLGKRGKESKRYEIGVLGVTFKEDCSDIRNSKSVELVEILENFGCNVTINDPHANEEELESLCQKTLVEFDELKNLDCLIIAVQHTSFKQYNAEKICSTLKSDGVIIDIKSMFPVDYFSGQNVEHWRF